MKLKKFAFALLLTITIPLIAQGATLQAFCSDGCTHFPNGTKESPHKWLHCCIYHDLAYWAGGTAKQRYTADEGLRQCVADTGEPQAADLIFIGVRIFGSPFSEESYRWGFGWDDHRAYRTASPEDQALITSMTPEDPLSLPLCK